MTTDRRTATSTKPALILSARPPYFTKNVPGQEELAKVYEQLTTDRDSCKEARTEVGTARGALEEADKHKRSGPRPTTSCVSEQRAFRRAAFQAAKSKFILHLWHLQRSWSYTFRHLDMEQPNTADVGLDYKLNVVRVTQLLIEVRDSIKDHERYLKQELPDHTDALHRQMEETTTLHDLAHSDVSKSLMVLGMLVSQKVQTLPTLFYSLHPAETAGLAPLSGYIRDLLAATRAFTEVENMLWSRLGHSTVNHEAKQLKFPTDTQDLCAYETIRQRVIQCASNLEKARYLAAARRSQFLTDTRENYVYLQTEAKADEIAEDGPLCDAFMHSISWLNNALVRATYLVQRFEAYKEAITEHSKSADGTYERALRLLKGMKPKK